jgi:ADP-ribose pyrophosphatase YjhB (NUDIX family)
MKHALDWEGVSIVQGLDNDRKQEIPGGKVDDTDETLLHATARELKEESGLTATRVVQKVQHFDFNDERPGRPATIWRKVRVGCGGCLFR